jgi:hypothetical protein
VRVWAVGGKDGFSAFHVLSQNECIAFDSLRRAETDNIGRNN